MICTARWSLRSALVGLVALGLAGVGCGRVSYVGQDADVAVELDAPPLDAWALDAAGMDAPATDAGLDAAPSPDALALLDAPEMPDALAAPDAFAALDALVLPDAFRSPDAFVSPDALVSPDAYRLPDAFSASDAPSWPSLAPIGYYPFEGVGDDVVYPPASTACAGCTYLAGHRGQAVMATTHILPDHATSSADFSVSLWISVAAMFPGAAAGCGTFITQRTSIEADDEPAALTLYAFMGGANTPSVALTPDAWTHVVMTYQSSTRAVQLYVGGVLVRTATSGMPDSLSTSRLGGAACAVPVDELFLFDRVLDASEVSMLFAM